MKNEEIQALVKCAYMEGWEIGWVTRHVDQGNENRICPWMPPHAEAEKDWEESEANAEIGKQMNSG